MSTTETNTRKATLQLKGDAAEFMRSTARQTLAYGGFGGGKTRTCCEKGYRLNMKYPGNRGLIVRAHTSDVAKSTVAQCLLEDVIPESHLPEGPKGHNKSSNVIRHFTGTRGPYGQPVMSEIHYHGLSTSGRDTGDGLPRKISGMQFGWIFVDEATEIGEGQWVNLIGRLRYDGKVVKGKKYTVPFRQIMAACNPAGKTHWLYRKFFKQGEGDDDIQYFHLKARDNPGVPTDYIEGMEKNYSGVYYDRYVLGKWVGTSSSIYSEFTYKNNVRDLDGLQEIDEDWEEAWLYEETSGLAKPPDDWDVFRTIDFGYPSPMVVQWWARSPMDRAGRRTYVLFREFYHSNTLVEDVAGRIQDWSKDLSIQQTFADPAQAQDRETLRRHGVSSSAAQKDVWNGIQEVKSQLNKDYNDSVPGIIFYEDSLINEPDEELEESHKPVRTVDEIGSYEWKKGDKDVPRKQDDHGMDAWRYLIYSLNEGGVPNEDELKDYEQIFNSGGF